MRLPALEKNILVYRALQMALFLFNSEEIKRTLIRSVGAKIRSERRKDLKDGKLLKSIFNRLMREELLTDSESKELQGLVEHRNQIAHQIHQLTGDIQPTGRRDDLRHFLKGTYDYGALTRVKKWHAVLWRRMHHHYIFDLSLDPLLFDAAEKAYEKELKSLKKRIDRQIAERKRMIANRCS